jgi:hypothetical protein
MCCGEPGEGRVVGEQAGQQGVCDQSARGQADQVEAQGGGTDQ